MQIFGSLYVNSVFYLWRKVSRDLFIYNANTNFQKPLKESPIIVVSLQSRLYGTIYRSYILVFDQ